MPPPRARIAVHDAGSPARRRTLAPVVAAVAVLAPCLSGGCDRIEAFLNPPAKEAAAAPPVEVVAAPVLRRDVERTREWVGSIDGSVNAEIRARVSGHLLRQHYVDGAFVRTGDLLFEIDPRPFEAALAEARARLAVAVAAQSKSQTDVERLGPLVEKRAVSQQEYDDAIAQNDANLAQIEAAQAAIEIAQLNLDFTRIQSPIDGIAGKAQVQIGSLVDPLSDPLTVISTVDPANVYFHVTEREYLLAGKRLADVRETSLDERPERMEIILADGKVYPHRARYFFTDRQVQAGTGTLRVALRVANPGNILRPGQYAVVRAVVESIDDAILVPQRAVREVQGTYEVAVVKPDDTVEIRQVVPGLRDGSDWVIEEGLAGDERVVVEGIQKVRPGTKVTVRAPAPKAGDAGTGR